MEICDSGNVQFNFENWYDACKFTGHLPTSQILTVPHAETFICSCDWTQTDMDCFDVNGKFYLNRQCPEGLGCYSDDAKFPFTRPSRGRSPEYPTSLDSAGTQYLCSLPNSFECEVTEWDISNGVAEVGLFEVPFDSMGGFAKTIRVPLFQEAGVGDKDVFREMHDLGTYALYLRHATENNTDIFLSDHELLLEQPKSTFQLSYFKDVTNITLHTEHAKFGITCQGITPLDAFRNVRPNEPYFRNTCEVAAQVALENFRNGMLYFTPQQTGHKQT